MENKFKIKELKLIPTEGSSLKEPWSLLRGGPIISYYENIRTPAITMSITFVDADGVVSNEGITVNTFRWRLTLRNWEYSKLIHQNTEW
jgi:hypothetical protein